jgi:hypothetical protein
MTATIAAPESLLATLRAHGIGRGRTRRLIQAPHSAIVRVTLPDGRWLQAQEVVRGADLARVFTVDPGPDADRAREIAGSLGWEV